MQITTRISEFVKNLSFDNIEKKTIEIVKKVVMDILGVTVAGSNTNTSAIMASFIHDFEGKAESYVIGKNPIKTSCLNAALANGVAAHAIDYDDIYPEMSGHPSAPLVAAIISLGQRERISGRKFLEAYIAGFEVESKLAATIFPEHDKKGWHSTSTTGVMGAAVASVKILDLDIKDINTTLGIAASLAGELRQNFGTMTKPLHVGNAARNGIFAALLARKGFSSYDNIIDTTYGFCKVFSGKDNFDFIELANSLGNPLELSLPGVGIKKYPSCYATHQAIDAVLYLINNYKFTPDDIEEIECKTAPRFHRVLNYHSPKTENEAKFSMEYCTARAVIDKRLGLEQFTLEKVNDLQVKNFEKRIKFTIHPQLQDEEGFGFTTVDVLLNNGNKLSKSITRPKGAPVTTLSEEELVEKYIECTKNVLSEQKIKKSIDILKNLEKIENIEELIFEMCNK